MPTKGLLIQLEVLKGKEPEAEQLLRKTLLTTGCFACFLIHFKENHYGIFGAFNSNKNRLFYLKSIAMKELRQQDNILFTNPPIIQKLDILANKLPVSTTQPVSDTKGILFTFKGKESEEYNTELFLRKAKLLADEEPGITSWFALDFNNGQYGIFEVFPDHQARITHLTGALPKKMIRKSSSILGSVPEMQLLTVLNESLITDAKIEMARIHQEF
jgi:hypothetical protein